MKVARSRAVVGTGYLGDLPDEALEVVRKAYAQPFAIASNYARENALDVAFAASMGWISSISPDGLSYSRRWHPTAEGLLTLRHHRDLS